MVACKVLFHLLGTAEVHSSMALFTNVASDAMERLNGICLMCLMYTVYTLECVSLASMG